MLGPLSQRAAAAPGSLQVVLLLPGGSPGPGGGRGGGAMRGRCPARRGESVRAYMCVSLAGVCGAGARRAGGRGLDVGRRRVIGTSSRLAAADPDQRYPPHTPRTHTHARRKTRADTLKGTRGHTRTRRHTFCNIQFALRLFTYLLDSLFVH